MDQIVLISGITFTKGVKKRKEMQKMKQKEIFSLSLRNTEKHTLDTGIYKIEQYILRFFRSYFINSKDFAF